MPAPEVIPVRRIEEEAGYVSFRPVVRQNFRLNDLLGLVLGVTGKHPERVRQILRSGSVTFHAYRYSWEGFQVEEGELSALLARFPDADASRAFRAEACTIVLIEGGSPRRPLVELERAAISRKRLLRRRSFWDALAAAAARSGAISYDGYSYHWRADLYRLALNSAEAAALAAEGNALGRRELQRELRRLERATHAIFVCPREGS